MTLPRSWPLSITTHSATDTLSFLVTGAAHLPLIMALKATPWLFGAADKIEAHLVEFMFSNCAEPAFRCQHTQPAC